MKKDTTKSANAANAANAATKPAKNPSEMSIQELTELKKSAKGLMVPVIEALISEKVKSEELQAKVRATPKREQKAPDSYNVLQPIFVGIRGSINKGIVENAKLVNIFNNACKELAIKVDDTIACKLFEKTIQHNSVSNIAKADSISSAIGRKAAYEEMIEQFKVLIGIIPANKWEKYAADYQIAYNKATKNLK